MHRRLYASLAALLLAGCATAEAPVSPPTPAADTTTTARPVKVLSWNLEHFVDPYDNPYIDGDQEDKGGLKTPEQLKLIALALLRADADVLALQEVEDDRSVKLFLDSHLPGHTYKYFASVPSIEWYQNTVIASRLPIREIISLREVELTNRLTGEVEKKYNSRLLFAEIQAGPDYTFLLGNLHLKSGQQEARDAEWRWQQATLVKDTLTRHTAAEPNRNILIVGDMNYRIDSPEYRHMLEHGTVPLIDLLADWNVLPVDGRDKRGSRIDHLFMNPAMAREFVPHSADFAYPLSHVELGKASDHLPMTVSFIPVEK